MKKLSVELNADDTEVNPLSGYTFAGWLDELDELCLKEFGLGVSDFSDWCIRDAYDDGCSPEDGLDIMCEEQDIDPRSFFGDLD